MLYNINVLILLTTPQVYEGEGTGVEQLRALANNTI